MSKDAFKFDGPPGTPRGSGHTIGYTVEVRSPGSPRFVGKQLVGERWIELLVDEGAVGVPNHIHCAMARDRRLLTYQAAMALAAWAAASEGYFSPTEYRLVRKRVEFSYSVSVEAVGDPMNFYEHERSAQWRSGDRPQGEAE